VFFHSYHSDSYISKKTLGESYATHKYCFDDNEHPDVFDVEKDFSVEK